MFCITSIKGDIIVISTKRNCYFIVWQENQVIEKVQNVLRQVRKPLVLENEIWQRKKPKDVEGVSQSDSIIMMRTPTLFLFISISNIP